ncbi:hypothetical protein BJP25_16825 [Actinokineospora bangkokensis]|uniref:MmyB-like transcription regulator ligand binding domain-containing protein n=1 Tax=Actinokineospora bangkokensis TaxID=1193682 RepID=A0A1Q9LMD4_9PSEU|nr:hypothetical protein BJP25_16825 [Actinokineospora bangkokensis]
MVGAAERLGGSARNVVWFDVGPIHLDGDVLQVPDSDVRVVVYSPEPDTEDAARLARLLTRSTVG